MKSIRITSLFVLILTLLTSAYGYAEEIDLPETGSDASNLRCPNGLISLGDSARDVQTKCGAPVKQGWIRGRNYDVSVYYWSGADFIHYLGFRDNKLQRIYTVNCIKGDPLCQ
ncbi:MAG: DUF2845 domain-containing protein [Desulfobacteraceae bacterium]|nr:DUF2845 domain-containing protein [Desulfobacteraceae bacterium]